MKITTLHELVDAMHEHGGTLILPAGDYDLDGIDFGMIHLDLALKPMTVHLQNLMTKPLLTLEA